MTKIPKNMVNMELGGLPKINQSVIDMLRNAGFTVFDDNKRVCLLDQDSDEFACNIFKAAKSMDVQSNKFIENVDYENFIDSDKPQKVCIKNSDYKSTGIIPMVCADGVFDYNVINLNPNTIEYVLKYTATFVPSSDIELDDIPRKIVSTDKDLVCKFIHKGKEQAIICQGTANNLNLIIDKTKEIVDFAENEIIKYRKDRFYGNLKDFDERAYNRFVMLNDSPQHNKSLVSQMVLEDIADRLHINREEYRLHIIRKSELDRPNINRRYVMGDIIVEKASSKKTKKYGLP